jgi:hypothetical protein
LLLARADKTRFAADGRHGAEALAPQHDQTHLSRVFMVVDHEHERRTPSTLHANHREELVF